MMLLFVMIRLALLLIPLPGDYRAIVYVLRRRHNPAPFFYYGGKYGFSQTDDAADVPRVL